MELREQRCRELLGGRGAGQQPFTMREGEDLDRGLEKHASIGLAGRTLPIPTTHPQPYRGVERVRRRQRETLAQLLEPPFSGGLEALSGGRAAALGVDR